MHFGRSFTWQLCFGGLKILKPLSKCKFSKTNTVEVTVLTTKKLILENVEVTHLCFTCSICMHVWSWHCLLLAWHAWYCGFSRFRASMWTGIILTKFACKTKKKNRWPFPLLVHCCHASTLKQWLSKLSIALPIILFGLGWNAGALRGGQPHQTSPKQQRRGRGRSRRGGAAKHLRCPDHPSGAAQEVHHVLQRARATETQSDGPR